MGLFSSSSVDAANPSSGFTDPEMEVIAPRILYSADASALIEPVVSSGDAEAAIQVEPAHWANPENHQESTEAPTALVVIDEAIEDTDTLLEFLAAEQRRGHQIDWLMISQQTDGINAVANALANAETPYDGIHVFSHGSDGELTLGNTTINQDSLQTHADSFSAWHFGLKADADILLYACDFSASEHGKALAQNLAVMTGADIASSNNATGHETLGGDWVLEQTTGEIETPVLLSQQLSASWVSTLAVSASTAEISVPADTSENDRLTNRIGGRQVASNGTMTVVVWERGDDVFFRRFQIDGTPLDLFDQQIENTANHANKNPTVAVASNGDFVIAYTAETSSNDVEIYAQAFNADGSPKPRPADAYASPYSNPNEFRVNDTSTDDQEFPAVVFRPDDTFAVSWTSPFTIPIAGTSDGVAYSLHNLDGTFIRNETVVSAGLGTDELNSAVATHPSDNSMVIVFEQDAGDNRVQTRRILPDGTRQNVITSIEVTDRDLTNPSAAIAQNGLTYITTVADNADILLWILRQDNTLLTTEPIKVNDVSGGSLINAQVSVQSNNSIVVVWETDLGPQDDEIAIRQYDGIGNSVAPESFVNVDTDGHQHRPSLALTGDTAIVVWSGDSATDNNGVFLRQMSVTEPALRVTASGSTTTEAGGAVLLGIRLDTRPTGNVSVSVDSSDGSEGLPTATNITFNPSNWNTEQFVTITGVDDLIVDGNVGYTISLNASSPSDPVYDALAATLIALTNTDDDVPVNSPVGTVTDTDPSASEVAENSAAGTTAGITAFADDPNPGDNVTYSITGPSASFFEIDTTTGVVTTSATPLDFETSASHVITVIATSSDTSTSQQDFTITVLDQNDNAPTIATGQTFPIAESSVNNSVVGTPLASDADTTTTLQNWTIVGGTGAAIFAIDAASGEITVSDESALDFESTPSLTLDLTVSDGVNTSAAQTVTINLLDVNEPPLGANAASDGTEDTDLTLTGSAFAFNDPDSGDALAGIEVRSLPGAGTLLLAGTALDGSTILPLVVTIAELDSNQLVFRPPANLNGPNVASFDIAVFDQAGERSVTRTQSINLAAVDDPPVFSSFGGASTVTIDVAENTSSVGTVTATDAEGELITYAVTGTDSAFVDVNPNTGAVQLLATDFESPQDNDADNRYEITVVATDPGGNTATQALRVNVTDQNDVAPVITPGQSFSIGENAANASAVSTPVATDSDGPGTLTNWTIGGGTGSSAFSIDSANGLISVSDSTQLDFESASTFTLLITVSDGVNTSATESVTINLLDLNEAPLGANAISDGMEDTDLILSSNAFAFNDPDSGDMLAGIEVRSLPTDGSLRLNGIALDGSTILPVVVTRAALDDGGLVYRPPANLNGPNVASFDIVVFDQAGERSVTRTQSINLAAVDDPPVFSSYGGASTVTLDVAENTSSVGTVTATDAEGELIQYTAVGTDAGFFAVDENSGALQFLAPPDFETRLDGDGSNNYEVTVVANDLGGNTATQALTVNVTNQNDVAPTIPSGQTFSVLPGSVNGSSVGSPAAADIDGPGTFTNWSITGGTGSAIFSIDPVSGEITVSDEGLLSATAANTVNLLITVSDGINTSAPQTVTLTLANVAPQTGDGTSIATEDTDYTFTVADFAFTDLNQGDALGAVVITSLPASGELLVNGIALSAPASLPISVDRSALDAGVLVYRPAPNAAGADIAAFTFKVADNSGTQSVQAVQTIDVLPVNDLPTIFNSPPAAIAAGDVLTISPGILSTVDTEDPADSITYTITANPTQGALRIDGQALTQGDRFTQADIDAGRIQYQSQAIGTVVDVIALRVADSDGGIVDNVTVSISTLGNSITPPDAGERPDTSTPSGNDRSDATNETDDSGEAANDDGQQQASAALIPPPSVYTPATNNSNAEITSLTLDNQASLLSADAASGQRELLQSGRWLASGHFGSDLARDLGGTNLEIYGLTSEYNRPAIAQLSNAMLLTDLEQMRSLLGEEFARQIQFDQTIVGSSVAVSTSLSIGYVLWLLRSGALLSSVLASIPAWRTIDPLPILASMPNRVNSAQDKSLEQMVDQRDTPEDETIERDTNPGSNTKTPAKA